MAIDGLKLNGNSVLVPPEISGPILQQAQDVSAVMQLARPVPISVNGGAIPVLVGDIEADWTDEGAAKHVASASIDLVNVVAKKVTTIIPFSEEIQTNLSWIEQELLRNGSGAIARAFDLAAVAGKKTVNPAQAGPFPDYILKNNTKSVTLGTATNKQGGFFGDVAAADELVSATEGKDFAATGAILDTRLRPRFRNRFDENGNRDDTDLPFPKTFGRLSRYLPALGGVVGDWGQAVYGVAMGLTARLSNQATLKVGDDLLPLWQHNMVGLLVEANLGFACADPDAFAQLAITVPEPPAGP